MFRYDYWEKEHLIRSDGFAYYGYIQGTLVHGDPLNTFHGELNEVGLYRSWMHEGLPGKYLPKMTMGLAYAWVPGFYVADLIAGAMDYPQDGWSTPYQLAVGFTAILFLLLGCWAMWSTINRRFSSLVATLTVIIIYFGTNLLQYGSVDPSMSHVYTFGLVGLFLWLSDRWIERKGLKSLIAAAFVLGWIVLIRPTNIVVGLFLPFALWQAEGHIRRLIHPQILIAALLALIPVIPQLIFWKLAAGEWLHYSYEQEAFYWLNPQIYKGLFSYRNGWLVYTPLMLLSLAGLLALCKPSKKLALGVLVIAVLHTYITFSWWCWYYGGSLSIRPMIDIYPILSLGMAACIAWILKKHISMSVLAIAVVSLFIWNNFLQVHYHNLGIITDSTMTKAAFWTTFMESEEPSHLQLIGAYRDPDTDNLRKGLPERSEYDTLIIQQLGGIDLDHDEKGPVMNEDRRFSKSLNVQGDSIPMSESALIEVEMDIESGDPESNNAFVVISYDSGEKNFLYQAASLEALGFDANDRRRISLFTKRPHYFPDEGKLTVYAYMKGKGEFKLHFVSAKAIEVARKEL